MHISNTGVLILLIICILSISILAGHFGVGLGEDQTPVEGFGISPPEIPEASGLFSAIEFGWDSLSAYLAIISFTVTGVPVIFSAIFLFMNLMAGWIMISLIRGTSS